MFRKNKDQRVFLFRYATFSDGLRESYWTGEWTNSGRPAVTGKRYYAKAFKTKREAYDIGGKHIPLKHFIAGWRDPGIYE